MINDTIEIDEWTPQVINDQLSSRKISLTTEAMNVVIAILNLDPKDREIVLRSLPAFMCMECGEASCCHGYSDE